MIEYLPAILIFIGILIASLHLTNGGGPKYGA